ncbi:bb5eedaf-599c-4d41-a63b-49484a406c85 [Thermothielavioides terrestris]|uniref:Bb5eedaf-599c-4d41-a63b-49484a406c85 n=1 Tax=Thermothielavioides terrestris TaxID=2587410 RepID=A0A446BJ77_9PEZI|nr:bb5eedaf-599c-4d41-a63b-49484a406c85 [Thermothielavioides terrestris]
MVHETENI